MKPKVRFIHGAWYVTGGLVPITLRFVAHETLSQAVEALCRWYTNGMVAAYK